MGFRIPGYHTFCASEQGTPIESFFLETFAWPIRKVINYWTLLRKSYKEFAKQVFNAQVKFPTKGVWITGVKDIMQKCDINYTEEEIKAMS